MEGGLGKCRRRFGGESPPLSFMSGLVFPGNRGKAIAKVPGLSDGKFTEDTFMDETNSMETEKGQLRAKLDTAIEKAQDLCERLQDQTSAVAKATDKTIREYPYQAIGVAFGLGVLIGVLVSQGRRD